MKKKVAVIESNAEYRNMMVEALQEEEIHEVKSAGDGKSGLHLIKSFQPDLVILEMFLPELNGFRLISELKSDSIHKDILVMIVTWAFVGELEEGKGFKIGGDKYFDAEAVLYKPFDEDLFLDKVEEVLSSGKIPKRTAKEKVLIVDNDPQIYKLLNFILRKESYETAWAENGKKGLEMLESGRPDIVLLDLEMPEMDGRETLERALKINPDLPIIMVTAHGSENKAVELLKAGAIDYIRKPFNNEEILIRAREGLKKAASAAAEKRFQERMAETTEQLMFQSERAETNPYGKRHIVLTFLVTLVGSMIGIYLALKF
jgi:DNA-binding response OmpR family regulator